MRRTTGQYRRCTIKLTPAERAAARHGGRAFVRRPVEWPLEYRVPSFADAYVDPGGTDLWGPGPYLKVPDVDPRDGGRYVDRVFCPWGYPLRRVRVMWSNVALYIASVDLSRSDAGGWDWLLTLVAEAPTAC